MLFADKHLMRYLAIPSNVPMVLALAEQQHVKRSVGGAGGGAADREDSVCSTLPEYHLTPAPKVWGVKVELPLSTRDPPQRFQDHKYMYVTH